MSQLARKSLFWLSSDIITYGLGLLTLVIIGRYMGPEPIGILGLATGFLAFFSFIPTLGLDSAHQKFYAENNIDKKQALGAFIFLKISLIVIYTLVVLIALFFPERFGLGLFTEFQKTIILIILLSRIIYHITKIQKVTFVAAEKPTKHQLAEIVNKVTLDILQILIAILGYGLIALSSAYVIGEVVAFFFCIYMFRDFSFSKPSIKYLKKYLSYGIPLFTVTVLASINEGIDRILIFAFNDLNQVAFYEVSIKLSFLFLMFRAAVSPIIFPVMSRHHSNNNLSEIKRISNLSEKYLAILGTPMLFFALLYAEEIIELLLGSAFLPASWIFRILLTLSYVRMIFTSYIVNLAATGYPILVGKIGVFVTILNIILSVLLIPKSFFGVNLFDYGALGASIATFSATTAGIIIHMYYSSKLNGTTSYPGTIFILIFGFFSIYVSHNVIETMHLNSHFNLLSVFIVSLLFYIILLYIFKIIGKKEINLFFKLINYKEAKKSLLDELK